ncbi:MAG: cellulase family glycosylhydrolase, partial [Prevotella sp.]|nr:cellulase family glycosylhydrolase [Prevotella sp.]
MNKRIFFMAWMLLVALHFHAQSTEFETATQAVQNMRVGWNLGNTFDSHKIGVSDVTQTETMRGQPVTKVELMEMMKMAGFNAIRVPVTWYPHLTDASGTIQTAWLNRIE